MKRILVMAFAILVVPAALAEAHSTAPKSKKIRFESAKAIAQAKVPRGLLTSHQFEHDHDRLVYSFEFKEAGKSGIKEVNVDATTGKVIKVKHQSIQDEQQERVKQAKKSATHN